MYVDSEPEGMSVVVYFNVDSAGRFKYLSEIHRSCT